MYPSCCFLVVTGSLNACTSGQGSTLTSHVIVCASNHCLPLSSTTIHHSPSDITSPVLPSLLLSDLVFFSFTITFRVLHFFRLVPFRVQSLSLSLSTYISLRVTRCPEVNVVDIPSIYIRGARHGIFLSFFLSFSTYTTHCL